MKKRTKKHWKLVIGNWSLPKGFSMAEMMIVTIIMAVLFSVGSGTYFNEKRRFEFNNSLSEVIQMIKIARNLTVTSEPIYVNVASLQENEKSMVPIDGYGVYINLVPDTLDNPQAVASADNPHIILFANKGDGTSRSDFQNDDSPDYFDATDEIIEEFRFPSLVHFRSLSFDTGSGLVEKWSDQEENEGPLNEGRETVIIFRPPLGDAIINNNNSSNPIVMDEVQLNMINPESPDESAKKCLFIRLNRIRTFPVLEFGAIDNEHCS